jgi:hypothetical protein
MDIWFREYFRMRKIRRIFKMRSIRQYPHIFLRGVEVFKNLILKKPNFR